MSEKNACYHESVVENNPDWFEGVKPERVMVDGIAFNGFNRHYFCVGVSEALHPEKLNLIKEAIEMALNVGPEQRDWKESTKLMMEAYGDNPKDFPYKK